MTRIGRLDDRVRASRAEAAAAHAARERAEAAQRREQWATRAAVVSALLIALLAGALAVSSAATRADEVSAQIVREAREQRAITGRAELAEANARLAAAGQPRIPPPDADVPLAQLGDVLIARSVRANLLADLADAGATTSPR